MPAAAHALRCRKTLAARNAKAQRLDRRTVASLISVSGRLCLCRQHEHQSQMCCSLTFVALRLRCLATGACHFASESQLKPSAETLKFLPHLIVLPNCPGLRKCI